MSSQQWQRICNFVASHIKRDHIIAAIVVAAVVLAVSINTSPIWTVNALEDPVTPTTFATDKRVDPIAGDRLAIYCNVTSGTLGVLGIANDGGGFSLTTFNGTEVYTALSQSFTKSVEPNGFLTIRGDNQWKFTVSWFGGPFGATGRDQFAKTFTCNLSAMVNATTIQATAATVPTNAATASQVTLQATGRLRVRSGPASNCPEIGVITPGTVYGVQAKNPSGVWLQINVNGQNGWVSAGFTRISSTRALRSVPVLKVDCKGTKLP